MWAIEGGSILNSECTDFHDVYQNLCLCLAEFDFRSEVVHFGNLPSIVREIECSVVDSEEVVVVSG